MKTRTRRRDTDPRPVAVDDPYALVQPDPYATVLLAAAAAAHDHLRAQDDEFTGRWSQ